MNEYEKQAQDFLKKTGTTLMVKFIGHDKYFPNDSDERDVYKFALMRGSRSYVGTFGHCVYDSGVVFRAKNGKTEKRLNIAIPVKFWPLRDGKGGATLKRAFASWFSKKYFHAMPSELGFGKKPTAYDILSCIPNSYPGQTFEDFCADYGYDPDSRNAYRIYEACKKELEGLMMLFNEEELEELREIS